MAPDPAAAEDAPILFADSFVDRYRGMLLGLLLGDVRDDTPPLRSGPLGQLVCHTLDSLVRVQLRSRVAGHQLIPLDELRSGLLRWGTQRGVVDAHDPTGWLARVPAMAADRGPSESDTALPGLARGQRLATSDVSEAEAMLRALPLAAYVGFACPREVVDWAQGSAALTHAHPEVWKATTFLVLLCAGHLMVVSQEHGTPSVDPMVPLRWVMTHNPRDPLIDPVSAVLTDPQPWCPERLAAHAPTRGAADSLVGGLYVARHAVGRPLSEVRAMASTAGDPHAVAALACALAGLERGMSALDPAELAAHELSWVLDGLVNDHVAALFNPITLTAGAVDPLSLAARYPVEPGGSA